MLTYEQRKEKVALILPWPGMGALPSHTLEQRTEVAKILLPNDSLEIALSSLPTMSNCNMTQLAFMRAAGVEHPILHEPYFPRGRGMRVATVDVQTIARELGAWCTPATDEVYFSPGDMPLIGGSGYEEHGLIVRSHDAQNGLVKSTDGGQGNHGAEIADRERKFAPDPDGRWWTWEGEQFDRRGRPLIGWVDLGRLFP